MRRAGRLALICGLVAAMGGEAAPAQERSGFTWDIDWILDQTGSR